MSACGEEQLVAVQRIEIAIENLLRHRLVERHRLVVEAGQEATGPEGGLALVWRRLEHSVVPASAVGLAMAEMPESAATTAEPGQGKCAACLLQSRVDNMLEVNA